MAAARPIDLAIQQIYSIAGKEDWRAAREQGLQLLARRFGATGASWRTSGRSGRSGPFTATAGALHGPSELAGFQFDAPESALKIASPGLAFAYRVAHRQGSLVSTFSFCWTGTAKSLAEVETNKTLEQLPRLLPFLVDASMLAMSLYIQRDEWLKSMGRNSRGVAALVDEQGCIYAATYHFFSSIGVSGKQRFVNLPFVLPENILDNGGRFERNGMQLRALRMDGLLLLHARKAMALDILSPREREIARVLSTGKTFKSVAAHCGIAVSTVANHSTRIYRKLGVYRREELMEMLREPHGITPKPSKPAKS